MASSTKEGESIGSMGPSDATDATPKVLIRPDGSIRATVTIDVVVDGVDALHRAALDEYLLANAGRASEGVAGEFEEMYGTPSNPDVANLTRLLFDSGRRMDGVSVQDSHAVIHSGPGATPR